MHKCSKLLIFVLLFLISCGGAAIIVPPVELPTVRSGETELSTDTVTAFSTMPSALNMTFSGPVESSTLNNETVIILCGGDNTNVPVTVTEDTDSDGIASNEFSISPIPSFPQLETCT